MRIIEDAVSATAAVEAIQRGAAAQHQKEQRQEHHDKLHVTAIYLNHIPQPVR
jgi:hypothetical protein